MLTRGLTGALLVTLVTLIPLAAASPPDQTWCSGIYDSGDYDDVVIAATSMLGRLTDTSLNTLRSLQIMIAAVGHAQLVPRKNSDVAVFPQFRAPPRTP